MSNQQAHQLLERGLDQLTLPVKPQACDRLIHYLELMRAWNKTHNLTSIHAMDEMVVKHVLDSLSIASYVDQSPFLDVGTGAGLPTIPLAIAMPDIQFTALDINRKRITFIKHCLRQLNIDNVSTICERVENVESDGFSIIASRAFSSLDQFVVNTQHLLSKDGRWFAMKARDPIDEKAILPSTVRISAEHLLDVPGLQAERRLIIVEQNHR